MERFTLTQLLSYTKNKLRGQSAFTLVELITAMTLLAIVSVMLFTICTGAITLIYRNSNKLDTVSGAKTELNNVLSGQNSTTQPASVEVNFNGTKVTVNGNKVAVEDEKDGIKSKMEAFMPNP